MDNKIVRNRFYCIKDVFNYKRGKLYTVEFEVEQLVFVFYSYDDTTKTGSGTRMALIPNHYMIIALPNNRYFYDYFTDLKTLRKQKIQKLDEKR